MAGYTPVETIEEGDEYYHVRYRNPDDFDDIRTPGWARNAAESVCEGSEVRTGHASGGEDDDWDIQSVLIPVDAVPDSEEAAEKAREIVEKIES